MMEREEVLKNYILMKYKSVRQFALENNIKYSTLSAILSRGLGKAGIENVFEICDALNISADALINKNIIVEKQLAKPHATLSRRLEAYTVFIEILNNSRNFTIDDRPLTDEEAKIFYAGIEAMIDVIRRLRKEDK